jgi:hypothetical protein
MSGRYNPRSDDDDDDEYEDEEEDEEIGYVIQPPPSLEAVYKVAKGLGSPTAAKSFVDSLKSKLRPLYPHLACVESLRAFRAALGEEMYQELLKNQNLRPFWLDWEQDRHQSAYNFAIDETLRHLEAHSDEVLPTRHEVRHWVDASLCFCGRCWG